MIEIAKHLDLSQRWDVEIQYVNGMRCYIGLHASDTSDASRRATEWFLSDGEFAASEIISVTVSPFTIEK